LSHEYDYFENWAQSGAGNQYIFNSVIECNQRNTLTKHDTVVIMWTSIAREDRYCKKHWITPGNIYSQDTYSVEFVNAFADNRGYLIRDLAAIQAVKLILDSIGCAYQFLSMIPIENISEFAGTITVKQDRDCLLMYQDTLKSISPSIFEVIYNKNWASRVRYASKEAYEKAAGSDWPSFEKYINNDFSDSDPDIKKEVMLWAGPWGMGIYDCHPIPILHAEYLVKSGFNLSASTMAWTQQMNNLLLNHQELNTWKTKTIQRL
jgi:hypothetical protein